MVNRIQAGGLSISALLITLALAGLLLGSGIPLHAGDNLEPEPTETPGATVTGTPEATTSVTAAATMSATATSEAEMTPTATLTSKVTASPVPTLSPRVYSQFLPYLTWYPPNNPPNCVPVAPLIATDPGAEQTITTALNNYRAGAGLQQLKVYPQIANAARRHAADMVDNAFVGHSGSDGSTVGERLTAACFHWTAVGQIIGINDNPQDMVAAWTASENNRAVILSTDFTHFGAGYAHDPTSGVPYGWTVVFARSASAGVVRD